MSVKLVTITPDAEKLIAYLARVSSDHQDNPDYANLIKYLLDHKHFSPFEMAHCVIEITTSRAIAAQILRHRSFSFQEFSQRYAEVGTSVQYTEARKQAKKNRQSSAEPCDQETKNWWLDAQYKIESLSRRLYCSAIDKGVAREQARFLLPLSVGTKLYMAGTIRSWLHYIEVRTQPDTQAEHRVLAEQCCDILTKEMPVIAKALGWTND